MIHIFSNSEVYEKAKGQLKRGKEMMNSVIFPLAHCGAWRHDAMFCFPQIDSREVFADKLHLADTELKVGVKYLGKCSYKLMLNVLSRLQRIITKTELEDENWTIHKSFSSPSGGGGQGGESYKRLASLMLGSQFVNFLSQSYSLQEKISRDRIRIIGDGGSGERTPLLPGRPVKFPELRGKPLGHISSILFNTNQQKSLLDSLDRREPTVILGNYGTGKTVVFQTAARTFNSDDDLNVHFISALGRDTEMLTKSVCLITV